MQLEGAKAELRSRPPAEAADLGLLVLRALGKPAALAWLSCVLPLQLLVVAACAPVDILWAYLALWWLKPAYDRAWGLVLGRGLFGDAPRGRAMWRALLRDGRRGLLADLTWRRLDPARTLVAPVALLEGLTGKPAARRRRALGQGGGSAVGQVFGASLILEVSTFAGLVLGVHQLMPEGAAWIARDLWSADWDVVVDGLELACYIGAIAIVEPLFVAAGFGLYINRRTDIEGWDVELSFRRMARRLAGGAAAALLLCGAGLALPGATPSAVAQPVADAGVPTADQVSDGAPGHSELVSWDAPADAGVPVGAGSFYGPGAPEAPDAPRTEGAASEARRLPPVEVAEDGDAAAAMARVLSRPELQREHVEQHWELRDPPEEEDEEAFDWEALREWLRDFASVADGIAVGFEFLLWALALIALAALGYLMLERLQAFAPRRAGDAQLPEFVVRMRVDDAQVPPVPLSQVVSRALALIAEGGHAAALSLLYVGTLRALLTQDGVEVSPQATEAQCVSAVRAAQVPAAREQLFVDLTGQWQLVAYAHQRPEEAALRALCERFDACFGARFEASRGGGA